MTPERDAHHAPQPEPFRDFEPWLLDDAEAAEVRCREINERRARVENSERLRHLRSL
jgi:hypothetical protein